MTTQPTTRLIVDSTALAEALAELEQLTADLGDLLPRRLAEFLRKVVKHLVLDLGRFCFRIDVAPTLGADNLIRLTPRLPIEFLASALRALDRNLSQRVSPAGEPPAAGEAESGVTSTGLRSSQSPLILPECQPRGDRRRG